MLEPKKKTSLTEPSHSQEGIRPFLRPSLGSSQSGFTIVESLVALMVAAILLTAISPLVVLSVVARVQARRVDLATQAARSYVDALRANALIPPITPTAVFSQDNPPMGVGAPTAIPDQTTAPGTCLDKNLKSLNPCDNSAFLIIQAFRNGLPSGTTTNDPATRDAVKHGYCLGVRVYRADAFTDGTPPTTTEPSKNMFGGKDAPLIVMKTEILNETSFEGYSSRFPTAPASPGAPPPLPGGSACG